MPASSPKELASPEFLREVLELADVRSALVVPLYLKAWGKMVCTSRKLCVVDGIGDCCSFKMMSRLRLLMVMCMLTIV